MQLSEAIRLGAMLKPKGLGTASTAADARRSCALGAAMDACSLPDSTHRLFALQARWPILHARVDMPACKRHWLVRSEGRPSLIDAIWILNDNAKWSRERIADWVETIEQQAGAQDGGGALPEGEPVAPAVETLSPVAVTRQ